MACENIEESARLTDAMVASHVAAFENTDGRGRFTSPQVGQHQTIRDLSQKFLCRSSPDASARRQIIRPHLRFRLLCLSRVDLSDSDSVLTLEKSCNASKFCRWSSWLLEPPC
jgi:hypothetical protein